MKKAIYILVMMFLLAGCASSFNSAYTLIWKYPHDIPDLELKVLNDTTGIIILKKDKFIKQDFGFIKQDFGFIIKKKYLLVITYIDDNQNLVSLKKGDTVYCNKNQLYIINENNKLFFYNKNKKVDFKKWGYPVHCVGYYLEK